MTRLTKYFESEETVCLLDAVESDDFPVLAQFAAESYHETYVENLHTAIKRTIFAVDNTSSTSLGGVCFENGQGKEIGSTKTVIPAECKGKATLVLDPAHLTSMLKTLDSDSMLTFVLNGCTPIGMTADNHSYQYFVMPVSNADIPYQVEVNGIDIGKMIEQRKAEELVAMVEVVKTGSDNPAEADVPPTDEDSEDEPEDNSIDDDSDEESENEESDEADELIENESEDNEDRISTDGHRLAWQDCTGICVNNHKVESAIISAPALQLLNRALGDKSITEHDSVKMAVSKNIISCQCKDVTFFVRLNEGRFPKWRTTIPDEKEKRILVKLDHTPLLSGIQAGDSLRAAWYTDRAKRLGLGNAGRNGASLPVADSFRPTKRR